ncbi:hypothetical protein ACFW5W_36770 [Streptomyces sp. NPDC058783]|uniref:hypothetical protein n=1 Tax=Streptomyces TaxID=1883 RepID=UPI00210A6E09|nr:hypothetical protein [Streptomyces coelicoflavus]MCQ4205496.1 hypothetical protein [Streptomyces coelicoflavus]
MSVPARRRACPHPTRGRRAATETLLHPGAGWWPLLWPLPWYLTPVAALTWGILRLREKAARRPPDDHDDLPAEEHGQAA